MPPRIKRTARLPEYLGPNVESIQKTLSMIDTYFSIGGASRGAQNWLVDIYDWAKKKNQKEVLQKFTELNYQRPDKEVSERVAKLIATPEEEIIIDDDSSNTYRSTPSPAPLMVKSKPIGDQIYSALEMEQAFMDLQNVPEDEQQRRLKDIENKSSRRIITPNMPISALVDHEFKIPAKDTRKTLRGKRMLPEVKEAGGRKAYQAKEKEVCEQAPAEKITYHVQEVRKYANVIADKNAFKCARATKRLQNYKVIGKELHTLVEYQDPLSSNPNKKIRATVINEMRK